MDFKKRGKCMAKQQTVWGQDRLTPFWGLEALVRLVGMRLILDELEFPILSITLGVSSII